MTFPKKDISNMISQEMNLKEQIHHHLFSDIVNGVYTPGSILHEKNLMEKYGVSRAPIREALIQLCSEGRTAQPSQARL